VSFAPGCGLWFLAQGEARWLDALEQVLRVLGDQGLGGKRSVGNGQFTHEPMPAPPLPAGRTGYVVLLSRTAPRLEEMPLLRRPQAAYDLVLVGGFTGTPGDGPVVRRQVRMLTEGSVVGAPAEGAGLGHLVDVTPEATPWLGHYVLRSGLGFAVPIQLLAADAEKETFR
jgi:CRISPR-associated protein Csm4